MLLCTKLYYTHSKMEHILTPYPVNLKQTCCSNTTVLYHFVTKLTSNSTLHFIEKQLKDGHLSFIKTGYTQFYLAHFPNQQFAKHRNAHTQSRKPRSLFLPPPTLPFCQTCTPLVLRVIDARMHARSFHARTSVLAKIRLANLFF